MTFVNSVWAVKLKIGGVTKKTGKKKEKVYETLDSDDDLPSIEIDKKVRSCSELSDELELRDFRL